MLLKEHAPAAVLAADVGDSSAERHAPTIARVGCGLPVDMRVTGALSISARVFEAAISTRRNTYKP